VKEGAKGRRAKGRDKGRQYEGITRREGIKGDKGTAAVRERDKESRRDNKTSIRRGRGGIT
jgi:hypothetical protein